MAQLLSKPFDPEIVHWRVGSTSKDKSRGLALAFLDARDVMERLDEVVGMENWQCRYPWAGCCELSIRIGGEWLTKANCAGATDIEGEKGQASTAFKRAAVLFGVGRYLYDLPSPWEDLDERRAFSKETQRDLTERLRKWQERKYGQ